MSGMWQPVKTEDKQEFKFILGYTKKNLQKELEKAEKKVQKESQKLKDMDMYNTTPKRRSRARMNVSLACEERDRWERRISIVEELLNKRSI
ncbi:hypothetical protein [Vallitalea guaymasensis]|uniref:hypothetical protein n=1 Tax=Vallitalea guaymasensis TaxID=1185412 RepID=UPI000DE3F24F|nr:hypothetical protein [Vallitalea guaymasensis]